MEKLDNPILKRPLYLYDLPTEILTSLSYTPNPRLLAQLEPELHEAQSKSSSETSKTSKASCDLLGSQSCALCNQTFDSVQEQKGHVRSDFHHFNLKQKLRGKKAATEEEFEKLVENLDESLSGSDSDTDTDESEDESILAALLKKNAAITGTEDKTPFSKTRGPGHSPLLWLSSPALPENYYFGVWRAIFTQADLEAPSLINVILSKQLEPIVPVKPGIKDVRVPSTAYKNPHVFLCMTGGGHFAAMVVSLAPHQNARGLTMDRQATVLAHKTFHKYTTRRKQGGSQSANDNAKGKAKSIGAQIRRANEQALAADIRSLLVDWKPLIDTSELLFVRATSVQNKRVLFGDGDDQVLTSKDPRLRGFPFSTKRATQHELMRAFIELTRLKIREIHPAEPEKASEPKSNLQKQGKVKISERDENLENALLHTTQIQSMIKRSKLPPLLAYLRNNKLSPDFRFAPFDSHSSAHAPTPLHMAAAQSAAVIVTGLLCKAGADPTTLSSDAKTPFDLAGDRATRDAFRVARSELGESKWNWEAARVPTPISKEDADKRVIKEREEEKARQKAELERLERETQPSPKLGGNGKKQGLLMNVTKGPSWEEQAKGMTPEMRRRLEREQRARAAEERLKRMNQTQN